MPIASAPTNVFLQQGNGNVLLSWDIMSGSTTYDVQRSTDGVSFSSIASPAVNFYLDSTVSVGVLYYYQVASVNGSGTSSYSTSDPTSIVPTRTGGLSLSEIRLQAQQRADLVNSQAIILPEWNSYINQAYFELYDLLVDTYEDYYVTSTVLTTSGSSNQLTLPNDFYKLQGVDLQLGSGSQSRVTLQKFDFIQRNRYLYPQLTSNYLGIFNLAYRLVGNTLMLIPQPTAGQNITVWYVPKLTQLLQDTDIVDGISGWTEYIIIDAAIRALQKEESDVSVLMAQKMALIKRIEDSAMNRDAGQPDTISQTRSSADRWGGAMNSYEFPSGGF